MHFQAYRENLEFILQELVEQIQENIHAFNSFVGMKYICIYKEGHTFEYVI